jgi:two-component system sensor histidine kinase NreB
VDLVLLLLAFGALGDVRAAVIRADARAAASGAPLTGGPALDRVTEILRELLPGVDPGEAAVEAERTRLAGDLHATVLPALRRAIAEVEAGGPPELLAERLRTVDIELERLMADRWPVVLDTFGLVPALEELAEGLERDSSVTVELSVESDTGRPPRHVERAAWRAAQVALDNAIRHASASRLSVSIATAAERLALTIDDDGVGFVVGEASGRAGRGIADLARRAESVGAGASVESAPGVGTTIRFRWPAGDGTGGLQGPR